MTKIHIKTPTSEYVIEDSDFKSAKVQRAIGVDNSADLSIPGLPIEPASGSGHKLEGHVANEAPVISTTFKDKEIRFESGKLAIIDAALLDAIKHPLEKRAIVIPVKSSEVTFLISGNFDDSVLNKLTIEPKVLEDDDMEDGSISDAGEADVIVDPDTGELQGKEEDVKEAVIDETFGMNHDNKIQSKLREVESMAQRKHNEGKEAKGINRRPVGLPKRDNGGRNDHFGTAASRKKSTEAVKIKESVESFLSKNINKTLTEEKIQNVDNRKQLANVLHTMLAMASAGWEFENGNLVHPLGVTISEGKWKCKDGYLVDEKGNRPSWDFDWAYNSREAARGE